MKKLLITLLLLMIVTLIGCDLTTSTSNTEITTDEFVPPLDNDYITQTSNTSDVDYESLFDNANYKRITIYFTESDLIDLIDEMNEYNDQFGDYRDNTIIPADVVYEDGEGNVLVMNEIGFRTKGNLFSRIPPGNVEDGRIVEYWQGSFQLEFNHTFEYLKDSPEYSYFKSREFFGDLEQLNFKRIRNDDYAVVTEAVAYEMFREVGVYTSNTSFCIVYLNVEGVIVPYGLFMIQETIDDVFVESTFGENNDGSIGELYKCTWQKYGPATLYRDYNSRALGVSDWTQGYRKSYALKTNKDEEDYSSFLSFVDLINAASNDDYYTSISASFDVDSFAKALAMHFLVGSSDDYRFNANNYYMYFNEGQAYYIPFDFDNSLGFGWNAFNNFGIYLEIDTLEDVSSTYIDSSNIVLVNRLLQEEEFFNLYLGYLDLYTREGSVFSEDYVKTVYDLVESLYSYEIYNTNDFLGVTWFNFEARGENSLLIADYINQKTAEVREQLMEFGY